MNQKKAKQNRPWVVTDENGEQLTIWESRSVASSLFVFTKDNEGYWRVLCNKRGKGCPDYVGYWVCPCGYLDYNETTRNAAYRECKEETGVAINENKIKSYKLVDHPSENRQNLTVVYYAIVENGFDFTFSTSGNEKDEVDEIAWMRVDQINKLQMAFGHKEVIKELFEMRVNLPWWKKIILNLYNEFLSVQSYNQQPRY